MSLDVRPPDHAGPLPDYCCAVLLCDGRFLLERRPLHKADAPGQLTCFGGRREPGEDPAQCIVRELREELGFVPESLDATAPAWALHVDGSLIAWFYSGEVTRLPSLEPGVTSETLGPDELNHPDLSRWHAAVLGAWLDRGPAAADQ